MDVEILKRGDILVLYRTSDFNKIAEYSSVVTSICVVEEVKNQGAFTSFNDFFQYACQYSVFDKKDLLYWYNKGGCKIIKFTYNIALKNRLTRHSLIEKVGLDRKEYWGFFKINDSCISTCPCNNKLRLFFYRSLTNHLVINHSIIIHTVKG